MLERKVITEEELKEKLYDIDISDKELAQYFIESPDVGDALTPVIIPNPELVRGSHLEGALVLNWFNNIARWRRNKIYKRRIKNWTGIRVVAEGDSWFQYPLKLKDVIDQLIDTDNFEYAVYGLSEAGDLLKNMVREDEICEAVERENPHIFLISGGGNDMVGGERIASMVHKYSASRKPKNYPNSKFKAFLDELENLYRQLFDRLLRKKPHLRIFCHGYDHALPDKGKWLGKPLAKAQIVKADLQRKIIAEMIDRFNQRLMRVAEDYPGAVYHVDCRSAVNPSRQWYDELHPNDDGYFEVAKRFDRIIQQALKERSASPSIRIPTTGKVADERDKMAAGHGQTVASVQQLDHAAFLNLVFKRAQKNKIATNLQPPASEFERRQLEKDIERHFEKVHKGADFLPSSFLEKGVERAQAVCRIVTDDSYGSGFLIATRDFVMTNNHVLDSVEKARVSKAQFDYDEDDLLYEIHFDPDRLFITDRDLDFTIVGCQSRTLPDTIVAIPLLQDPETVTRNERVNIIQHPRGRRKELSLHDNKVSYVYDKVIRYTADTEGGSSGSPVFNNQWDLVALHHAGWNEPDGGASNEGVRMTAIVNYLLGEQETESCNALDHLIQTVVADHPAVPGKGLLTPLAPRPISKRPETGRKLTLNIEADIDELTIRMG